MNLIKDLNAIADKYPNAGFGTEIAEIAGLCRVAAKEIESLEGKIAKVQRERDAAVEDMNHIANKILESKYLLEGGTDKVADLSLGRCDVCKKVCHQDKPCQFEWRGPQAGEVKQE